ncbi:hypothetical protein Sjap_004921 [Stephania japonica]|uniref:Uncharacterized protein n=1 Tax=Stephania japonica TaxID=461633 RepID=A0AAP0K349_9MAGN
MDEQICEVEDEADFDPFTSKVQDDIELEKRDGTPKDQLSSTKQTLKELQRKREERMKEFFDIQSQIIQVHEALRGSIVDGQIVDDKDLTTKRLRELKLVLQGLQSEKAARSAVFRDFGSLGNGWTDPSRSINKCRYF